MKVEILDETCARTEPYGGRKYSNGYYLATNVKIKELEMNDIKLQNKLNEIINHTKTNSLLKNKECLKDDSKLIKVNRNKNRASLFGKPVAIEKNVTEVDSSSDSTIAVADTHSDISKTLQNKFSNKSKLISWLETSYKQYKRKADLGNINLCLGPPQPGKMALYPWDFILSRYRERKNYFLITKTKPYRLFMTVNENNQFFASSTNINNIPWSEIDKYPITVRNLLTNATDIRDNFFILFGLTHSWELVGSVTKISESIGSADVNLSDCQSNESHNEVLRLENILNTGKPSAATTVNKEISTNYSQKHNIEEKTNESGSDSSKWFVMTIENDFSEIQFFNKGFFVKYESVMRAINVSRASKKTVRLSSQKCNSRQSDPQFGIYAIPSENDFCVFIGPYEKDEELGIETINTTTDPTRKRTRGVWITTEKIDNLRVIDNPLSFMPTNFNISNEIPLHSHFNTPNIKGNDDMYSDEQKKRKKVVKTLKPIRIGKSNGFYHLASDGLLHQISPEKSQLNTSNIVVTLQDHNDKSFERSTCNESENKTQSENHGIFSKKLFNKPIAEIAPQQKSTTTQMPVKRKLEGMFILNPEEINQRSFEGRIRTDPTEDNLNTSSTNNIIINNDIEKFLASSTITEPPNEDIFIISDEEDVSESPYDFKYQYIICKNIKSLGWIHGRRDSENRLSFEFPGFKETEFYPEHEAFEKINQVFSRKVYVPKNITLEWCTVDDLSQIEERQKLESHELNADHIMTKKGLCHKSDVIKNIKTPRRSTETTETDIEKCLSSDSIKPEFNEMKNALLKELEETSAQLEDESDMLLTETLSRKETFLDTLGSMSENARRHFSEKLQEMYSSSEELSSDT
ncbi:uncharacterized protein LOC121729063 [Aricia agestis]|uniref:uncharacterized protein LOC121729063 n=1 Tax=Aricia agestis TaxID=91739 RepID=UPI001C20932D|nr:uncharacterized protein LOC121729063 [Aricia agestis]